MRIVIALGGNALGDSPSEQLEIVKSSAKAIVDLVQEGHDLVVCHGNGPQVGMINLAFESSHEESGTPLMPLVESGAMSQGYIGYHLQQAIGNELRSRSIKKSCVSLVSQVEVSLDDKAFFHPTKPIGRFYSKDEAYQMALDTGYDFTEDAGRGYRRVVASPSPLRIIEEDLIRNILESGSIVIAGGGGGIPVTDQDGSLAGMDAVIDKDKTASLMARALDCDMLMILTAVDRVSINYNTPDQVDLDEISLSDIEKYIKEGQFAPGSMLPKIEACVDFIRDSKDGSVGLISSLARAKDAIGGLTGTQIVK